MDVTVAVCTHDRVHLLGDLFDAIVSNLDGCWAEILFVDSASSTPVAPVVRHLAEGAPGVAVRCERVDVPGETLARNLALAEAGGKVVAFLDDDARPRRGWLAAVLRGFTRGGDVAAVGGPIALAWGVDARPPWMSPSLERWFSALDLGAEPTDIGGDQLLFSANLALRRDLALAAGGFPDGPQRTAEALLSGVEIQLQRRLQRAGHRIRYEPDAAVDHFVLPERRSPRWVLRRAYGQGRSEALLDRIGRNGVPVSVAARRVTAHALHRAVTDASRVVTGPRRRAVLLDFASTRTAAVGYAVEALRHRHA